MFSGLSFAVVAPPKDRACAEASKSSFRGDMPSSSKLPGTLRTIAVGGRDGEPGWLSLSIVSLSERAGTTSSAPPVTGRSFASLEQDGTCHGRQVV